MKILTFDTSLDKTYVTLSDNGIFLSDEIIENHNEKYHSAFLIPTIVSILKNNQITMQDIDVIGTNVGPGSFTGIRACVTVARVMAQQLNIPLVGVSSLEILSKISQNNDKTIVVLDARKQHFYNAIYENSKEIQTPVLISNEDLLKLDFNNANIIADKFSHDILNENGINSIIYTDTNADLGKYLNNIVSDKISGADENTFLWSKLKPLYLQAPPVTISSKNKPSQA